MTKDEPEDAVEGHIALTPLRRSGTPLEIARRSYLASDESSFVTGTELVINGGYLSQ